MKAVGGTVDNEDSYEETVYREAEEELGIKGVTFTLGPRQFVAGPPANYFVQWYYVNARLANRRLHSTEK